MARSELFGGSYFWRHRLSLEGVLGDHRSREPKTLETVATNQGRAGDSAP